MTLLGTLIISWFLLLAALRFHFALRLRKRLHRQKSLVDQQQEWPPVLAMMTLRGGDEQLTETLSHLTSMDYPDYRLRIVIDSENDPVRPIIENFVSSQNLDNVEITFLEHRLKTCSGKISSFLEATDEIPEKYKIITVFDGDAVLDRQCLKELVAPLLNGYALTTGNRWYCPPESWMGVTRYIWSGLAFSLMSELNVVWGGCIAMHKSTIESPELRQRLSKAFGEDSTISTYLIERNEPITFVPQAIVLNDDDIGLKSFYNFLMRQYLSIHLNSDRWKFVFPIAFIVGLSAITANAWLVLGGPAWWELLGSYSIFISMLFAEIGMAAQAVRTLKMNAGISYPKLKLKHFLIAPIAIVILNYTNFVAILHAAMIREHVWRGITYRFKGQHKCEVVNVAELSPASILISTHENSEDLNIAA